MLEISSLPESEKCCGHMSHFVIGIELNTANNLTIKLYRVSILSKDSSLSTYLQKCIDAKSM